MQLSLKPACPDCGKRSFWFNYLFKRSCPNCKTEFTLTRYSIIISYFASGVIAVTPALGIIAFSIKETSNPLLKVDIGAPFPNKSSF